MATPIAHPDRPLNLGDTEGCALLREAFLRAGYLPENLQRLFGMPDQGPAPVLDKAVCLRRLRDEGALATLVRLFQLRDRVPESTARAAFGPLEPARLQSMGLLDLNNGEVSAPFTIAPFEGFLFVSDWIPAERSALPANCVTGLNPTTVLLAQITIRRTVQAALDMGTGSGVHALLASRHARHVVATDINPRALNMTAFNALLNGVGNIECRQGSFYEPVDGETFDFISTNPPFVISPDTRYLYRDGNRPGDAVCAEVLNRLPDYLCDGGIGHMLGNWACRPDGDWTEPPRRWLDTRGCDVLALLHEFDDPVTYAARWLRAEWPAHSNEYGSALDRWLSYYHACGIEAIAAGAVLVRKRGGENWFQGFPVGAEVHGFCGEQINRLLSIQDHATHHLRSAEDLLDCRLTLREHRLEQVFHFERERYQLHASLLRLHDSLPLPIGVDGFGIQLLSSCDGRHTLRDVLSAVAARHDVSLDDMIAPALASIRNLVARGYLLPVELTSRQLNSDDGGARSVLE
jgi:Methyltransferase small domain